MPAATNLLELIGEHLLTVAAEAEDNYWRAIARKKRANSAGLMWLNRHGPASKTLDLTTQQLEESEEELKAAMMGMARTRIALTKAEAAYSETLLKVLIVRCSC
jgi:hypothetical protein